MKAVILAAGQGRRLRPLTNDRPKALVELAGKPFLEHVLEALSEAGVLEVGIVVGRLGEKIEEKFGEKFGEMKLSYLKQENEVGTAKAVYTAKGFVGDDDFICAHADVIIESGLYKKLIEEFHGKEELDAVIVGREVDEPWRYGVLRTENCFLKEIVEKPEKGKEPGKLINAGVYWFSRRIFKAIEETGKSERGEFELTDSIMRFAENNRAGVLHYEGKCFDIGSVEDLKNAEKELSGN